MAARVELPFLATSSVKRGHLIACPIGVLTLSKEVTLGTALAFVTVVETNQEQMFIHRLQYVHQVLSRCRACYSHGIAMQVY